MILVETSVWIDHLRGSRRAARLPALLEAGDVMVHPWVVGELSLGTLGPRRAAILRDLDQLPTAPVLPDDEVRAMIEARDLAGSGIGWVDAQILASALATPARLWTLDGPLARAMAKLGVEPA